MRLALGNMANDNGGTTPNRAVVAPIISGTGYNGQTLTAIPGIWTNPPTTGQWFANGVAISGQTSLTYVVTAATSGLPFEYRETRPGGVVVASNSIHNWNPSDLTTSLWLDAADSSNIVQSGGLVSQWTDKSGSGRHATQATSGARPTINTSTLNGLAVMDFSTGDQFMELAAFTTSRTVIMISRNGSVIAPMLSGARGDVSFTPTWNANGERSEYRARSNSTIYTNLESGSLNDYGLIIATQSANSISVHSFADEVATTTAFTANNSKIDAIGRDYSGTDQFSRGRCAEIITVDSVISTDIRQRFEGYLAHKWGQLALLPVDHPYKTTAPTV